MSAQRRSERTTLPWRRRGRIALGLLTALAIAAPGTADVPYPTCEDAGCSDPSDFGAYLFLPPGVQPNDFDPASRSSWKYNAGTGMDIPGAWQTTTGRPDVVTAVLDSGIRWSARDVARKVALNAGELPPGPGCTTLDCNGDGFLSVDDYAGVPDHNGNGLLDGQDLIREYSDGVDDDANGYVDDIAGWDFFQDDNDPDDDVDYGHGTGEAEDSTGEANNGSGMPGVAPSSFFLPLRVGDSFVAIGSDFAQAVVYATDRRVAVVQEALGAVTASDSSQGAIDYAYRRGIPVVASAADEESRHHNLPAALDHTLWVNSIVHGDGTLVEQEDVYDLVNGCTNYGGRAWSAIPSNSCSSEATGRASGLVALLVAHGRNLMEAGELRPYPGLDTPFSAEEVRQLFRQAAQDVDHEDDLFDLSIDSLLGFFLSAPGLDLFFGSQRFPTQAGWDQFTGYGRPDAPTLLAVTEKTIPPEADLSGTLAWFDTIDPVRTPRLTIRASAAARRARGRFDWSLEVGCGIQPKTWTRLGDGRSRRPLVRARLATWQAAETAEACGFDPTQPIDDPDAHTVTLRLRVLDRRGNLGEDRRTVAVHADASLRLGAIDLGSSLESSPALADVDRDGVLDVIQGASDGRIHVLRGSDGTALPGFPVRTAPLPVHASPGYASGEVPLPHEAILAPLAADDLDGDGRVEIVAASVEGRLYVFDDHGRVRPNFPRMTDPARSATENRNRLNDADPGIVAAPTLVDLDPPGTHPDLEIVTAALDGHVYAWRADGSTYPGFPVRIADRTKVAIDPATGRATPIAAGVRERAAKIIGSPAVGDLDGDGRPEIVVASNEEYAGEPGGFLPESPLLGVAQQFADQLGGGFSFDTGGRLYALHPDGGDAVGGPVLPGWPVQVPVIAPGILPTVGTGVPGSPALADLDGSGSLAAAIFGVVGPALLFDGAGTPLLGEVLGVRRAFAADFLPGGFPSVPPTAGSADAPFFPGIGSGAFGDLTGDGLPEYVAPTAGLRKLLDLSAPAEQTLADHQVSAWNPRDGSLLPAFPRVMDDLQFFSSPGLADVDGDGVAEIVQGSGAYLVRAYRADGSTPPGFPKFTHGWVITSPTAGDIDGDGEIEIVAGTREGRLYLWDTPAPAVASAIPWQGYGRDRRNTQNLDSGVSPLAASRGALEGLLWQLEALRIELLTGDGKVSHHGRHNRHGRHHRHGRGGSDAERALDRVIAAFEAGEIGRGTALLFQVERALWRADRRDHGRADLYQRFLDAVRSGVERSLAGASCARDDVGCHALLARAEHLARRGAFFARVGAHPVAVWVWSRALLFSETASS